MRERDDSDMAMAFKPGGGIRSASNASQEEKESDCTCCAKKIAEDLLPFGFAFRQWDASGSRDNHRPAHWQFGLKFI